MAWHLGHWHSSMKSRNNAVQHIPWFSLHQPAGVRRHQDERLVVKLQARLAQIPTLCARGDRDLGMRLPKLKPRKQLEKAEARRNNITGFWEIGLVFSSQGTISMLAPVEPKYFSHFSYRVHTSRALRSPCFFAVVFRAFWRARAHVLQRLCQLFFAIFAQCCNIRERPKIPPSQIKPALGAT